MIITRQWLRDRGACYDDAHLAELVPPEGVPLLQVLDADLPAEDRLWALLHDDVLGREGVVAFARWCAERAQLYADSAPERAQLYAGFVARAAAAHAAQAIYAAAWVAHAAQADAAARSAAADADAAAWAAERQAQLDWIRHRLETQC